MARATFLLNQIKAEHIGHISTVYFHHYGCMCIGKCAENSHHQIFTDLQMPDCNV